MACAAATGFDSGEPLCLRQISESGQRPLMYVATHDTNDPTLATLPFLVATGAANAEIDCCIALLGESV